MSTTKKIIIVLMCLLAAGLGTGYFLGLAYFQTHLKIGTTINGFQCSFKTVEEATELLTREVNSYAIAVETRNNGIEKIEASEVGLEFIGQQAIIDILNKQNYKLWFVPEIGNKTLSVDCYSLDETTANEKILNLKCMQNMVKGQTATIVDTNGVYQVSPGIKGTDLDKEKAADVIKTAIRQWKTSVNLEDTGCYIDADMADEEELQKQCDFLNSIQETILTYDFDDRVERVTMDTVREELLDENFLLTKESVTPYLTKIAEKYDTVGAQRKFVTFNDKTAMISGGDYGWKMDIEKTAEELVKYISDDTIDVIKPEYEQAAVSRKKNDIGYSYLEINITTKDAVLYIDGEPVVQTTVLTGQNMKAGCYRIIAKQRRTSGGLENAILFANYAAYKYDEAAGTSFSGNADISAFASNGINDGCIAFTDEPALETIFEQINESWPVIIYSNSNIIN